MAPCIYHIGPHQGVVGFRWGSRSVFPQTLVSPDFSKRTELEKLLPVNRPTHRPTQQHRPTNHHLHRRHNRIQSLRAEADGRSLILLDELGTGTDPGEGAALGVALLRRLVRGGAGAGALTVATTHHSLMTKLKFEDPRWVAALLVVGVCREWCRVLLAGVVGSELGVGGDKCLEMG